MQVDHNVPVETFHSFPTVNAENSVPHRDPRLQINGLVNQREEDHEEPPPPIKVTREHGRFYYYTTHNKALYPFPIDQFERDTSTEFHHFIHGIALNKKLYNADLSQCPPGYGRRQVLDVGCGTGDWCEYMALAHPEMDIHGIDLFINHPDNDPTEHRNGYDAPNNPNIPNCTLHMPVDFTQDYWLPFQEGSFDFIRAARLCGSVPDWNHLYWCISRYLKPGGFIEHIELDFEPRTMRGYNYPPEAAPLLDWWDRMKFASSHNGKPIAYRQDLQTMLENWGFSSFNHQTICIPLKRCPGGSSEKHLIETFLTILLSAGRNAVIEPLYGLSASLLARYLKMSNEEIRQLCGNVWTVLRKGLEKKTPVYFNLHVLTAKKAMR